MAAVIVDVAIRLGMALAGLGMCEVADLLIDARKAPSVFTSSEAQRASSSSSTQPPSGEIASRAPHRVLDIKEVSARTGHSPDRIRHLRVAGHELYDKAWKNGDAASSPLMWDEADVDAWVEEQKDKTARRR